MANRRRYRLPEAMLVGQTIPHSVPLLRNGAHAREGWIHTDQIYK